MIIGITGTLGAGKGTVVEFLVKNGFKHFSVRDFLIEEINKRGLEVNRDSMVMVANQLREMNSPSYIIEQLYAKAQNFERDCVIESIRTPGEVEAIKKRGGFLLAVDADPQIRYVRILTRQSETDNISYDEFIENEKREMFSENPNKQNLSKCIEMADFTLNNDRNLEELYKQIGEIYKQMQEIEKKKASSASTFANGGTSSDKSESEGNDIESIRENIQKTVERILDSAAVKNLEQEMSSSANITRGHENLFEASANTKGEGNLETKYIQKYESVVPEKDDEIKQEPEKVVRPSWDEYFMKITALVAERSTCLRHNVGALIVKDKRILTTGYNGAVRGAKDCLTKGCKKDELNLESGFGAEQCRAVHAEQNAIIQAGFHGTNINGGTIYCTHIPCRMCAKQIINSGLKKLVYYFDYAGSKDSLKLLEECGIEIKKMPRPEKEIKFKD